MSADDARIAALEQEVAALRWQNGQLIDNITGILAAITALSERNRKQLDLISRNVDLTGFWGQEITTLDARLRLTDADVMRMQS